MSEYCEYMWDPSRGHLRSTALARSIYESEAKFDVKDRKLAIKTVRAMLREMPGVDLNHCTDEYVTRFLLARKYRTEQAAALIVAYQSQIAHRQDIFGNLTARDPPLQRALRAGIPGVLPARDRKGRCVLVILASQWDPIAVPALSVQRAIFLVLETLIQDPRNQQCGFVAVVDWSGFSLRQGGALGAAALRNLIAALRGRFPARFKAIHFLSAPLYVQATLALVKPFLDEKTRHKIYLHGNNLSTLHEHLPTDILPAELGGTGPAFNPGLWAEPVIHSAMKEAEIAAAKRDNGEPTEITIDHGKINDRTIDNDENRIGSSIEKSSKKHYEVRTPGNGESTSGNNDKTKIAISDDDYRRGKSSEKRSIVSRDSEQPDGRESEISFNCRQTCPLIEQTNDEKIDKKSNERLNVEPDTCEETNFIENTENSTIDDEKIEKSIENSKNDENFTRAKVTKSNNCEADERTRFRIYRDTVDASAIESMDKTVTRDRAIVRNNEEIEIIDCIESEANSSCNEFEMIPSQPGSDESRENSMDHRQHGGGGVVVKNVGSAMKIGKKNGSSPEQVNLIT